MHVEAPRRVNELPAHQAYAALDLGTNNCRLLIAAAPPLPNAKPSIELKVLDSFSRIVRLGEGVGQHGRLSADAMERTLNALAVCKKKLDRHAVAGRRFVATEACRRAQNAQEFLDRVYDTLGLEIGIISPEEEARLAFMGCCSLIAESAKRALVFDIGGGSTELMWIDHERSEENTHPGGITDWLSLASGVMNLADRFGGHAFAELTFDDMVDYMVSRFESFDVANGISEAIQDSSVQLLSTSGTVTTLAAIHLGLPRYDRARIDGIRLPLKEIRATIHRLLAMRPSERFHHPCIGPDRADFIISGCAIFEAIAQVWPTKDITIADRGVREGIILSLMQHVR